MNSSLVSMSTPGTVPRMPDTVLGSSNAAARALPMLPSDPKIILLSGPMPDSMRPVRILEVSSKPMITMPSGSASTVAAISASKFSACGSYTTSYTTSPPAASYGALVYSRRPVPYESFSTKNATVAAPSPRIKSASAAPCTTSDGAERKYRPLSS